MESPSGDSGSGLVIMGSSQSGHVRQSPQISAKTVHVSDSGAQITGGGSSITTMAGVVVLLAEQGLQKFRVTQIRSS